MLPVTGNTYPVKEQLKSLGGKWNPFRNKWMVPADKHEEAQALVNSQETESGNNHSLSKSPRKCVVCGAVAEVNSRGYPTTKIYRTGECQDCFEERKQGY